MTTLGLLSQWPRMITLGAILSGLSWLVWPLCLWSLYGAISIIATLVRVGVESGNRYAMMIDRSAPALVRQVGMKISGNMMPRVAYAVALVALGWLGRDSWEYHHTFVLTDLTTIAEPGDRITVEGRQETVAENTWWFQRNASPVGQAFPFTFCNDYIPALKRGQHVEVIVYAARKMPVECSTVASNPLGIIYR